MSKMLFALAVLILAFVSLDNARLSQEVSDLKRQLGTAPAPVAFMELEPGETLIAEHNQKGEWTTLRALPLPRHIVGRVRIRIEKVKP